MKKHFPLNVPVTDKFTNQLGILSLVILRSDGSLHYGFSPARLHEKKGVPASIDWITSDRVQAVEGHDLTLEDLGDEMWEKVLGTIVTDTNTGFTGVAVELVKYINGCVHFNIQAEGLNEKSERVPLQNFDIRQLKGDAIPKKTAEEVKESKKTHPSPIGGVKQKKQVY